MERRAALMSVAVVLGVLGLVLLVGWGATAGPGTVVHGDHATSTQPPSVQPPPSASAAPTGGMQPGHPPVHHRPVFLIVVIAVATIGGCGVVVVLLGLLAARLLRAIAWRRRPPDQDAPPPANSDYALPSTATTTVGDAIAEQLAELDAGTPREAIAVCWRRLESTAEQLGVPPRRSDTPTDFVVRLLSRLGTDPEAADALAALYREARFSAHAMTEDDRARARTLLERLLTSLRARA